MCLTSLFFINIAYSQCSERLSEDDSFPMRHLASLVASKIYFHLEEYKESLRYGLGAEGVLDLTVKNSYTETIVGQRFCPTSLQVYVLSFRQIMFISSSILILLFLICRQEVRKFYISVMWM